jgi:uncharacterized protein YcbX
MAEEQRKRDHRADRGGAPGGVARVIELNYYPIKGCAGTSVSDAVLTPAGLTHDRSFMVIGKDGVFRSQRRDPRLAVIRPEISIDGERLTLRAPGTDAVCVDVDLAAARRDVNLFGAPYTGIDQGDTVAGWLSEVLGAPSRLVRVPPEHDRVTDGETPGTSGYADSCPVLLTSLSSLDLLNERLTQRGGEPLPMNRFRPNIVVAGWDEPHIEDRARRIAIGAAELGYAKLAIRCVVTTVDQESGTKTGPEPLRTLADYRRVAEGLAFGAKFAVARPGKLAIGDEVIVSCWGA